MYLYIYMILLQILMINGSFDDVKSNFDRWVIELGKSFSELHTITGEPYLKSIYKTTNFGAQEINETIATTYLNTAIKKLENIVSEKTKLVENIKVAAEEAFVKRAENEPIGVSSYFI
ncbi:Voltage-dependent calcium channel subunit alpha-2/delta-4 [Schistosoma haematobium]|uniref:Voltage-dependent calcium channel subunit alpha-2/delta-4 n=1 Tax=Schistosoma haematobium TaxID=6185 RepID=A0A922LIM0_SCHHA|nr:Voltage-dependent calcium channel subunit alpha-2/delta-4 [Schistosoma haematobium]KAH9585904.1 Voltage-dependent calcium channel subunit alpha-2/delta-4 [Schistosoma haematobium]